MAKQAEIIYDQTFTVTGIVPIKKLISEYIKYCISQNSNRSSLVRMLKIGRTTLWRYEARSIKGSGIL